VDGELRRVNADGQAARIRGDVVTGECALAALVESSARGQGERMSRNDESMRQASAESRELVVDVGRGSDQNFPSCVSK
jgi:hypothetical protein